MSKPQKVALFCGHQISSGYILEVEGDTFHKKALTCGAAQHPLSALRLGVAIGVLFNPKPYLDEICFWFRNS